ncbi:BFD domain protein (2Fe-2S)-binding domain protein [Desulfotomaculum nigrificans CO-1-SRB]|uniref:BFD domain protein (2Fe-2S)-binding domain protein n=2 Tax=Desulfotomaculum nigrificans TaxID=1565 RepID=F6B9U6_DESCC|nr:BFD domain protein (2Fe-2S)-binding domain protein [Desulfotomaculum nigrificans CO-1-SRB]
MITDLVCGVDPKVSAVRCPVCGAPGKPVKPATIKNIVKESHQPGSPEGFHLCLSETCEVVYFGPEILKKDALKEKVWFKETDPEVPVCYCKGVSAKDIMDHLTVMGCCHNLQDIQRHTGANTGRECLTKNPAGT